MAEYAKISTDGSTILARKAMESPVLVDRATAEAIGKPFWLPVVRETVDTSTSPDVVTTVNAPVIEAARVYIRTDVRDKTAQEIDDEADAEAVLDLSRKTGKALFTLANRIRALEGDPPYTVAQFKAFWKSL